MFCDISPTCYKIALQKEICKRHIKNFFAQENYADTQDTALLPCIVAQYSSHLIKRGKGIDPVLQENKAVNIRLANERLNGILIRPGETFSFWHRVGKTTKRKGYRDGRILVRNHILPGIGGGLCNLANTIHRVVLVSPLTVTEFHKHSDALAPDEGPRVPFSSGTSVFYNNGDYRFKNEMDQTFQLLLWCMRTTSTPSCAVSAPCPAATALWRKGTTSKKRAENITVCRRFTRRHWTHRPGSCCIGSLCWTTIPKSCMTPR